MAPFPLRVTGACTRCGACSLACRYDALTPASARTVFLVVVLFLHAVFLGVARI